MFLFLNGMLFSQLAFSQNTDYVILKFAPLSLIDPYGPNIQFGAELIQKGKISFELDFALFLRNFYLIDKTPRISDRKGFKLKPEIRFFLSKENIEERNRGLYLANELFFVKDNFKRNETFRGFDQELNTYYVYYSDEIIDRFEIGDNIIFGYQAVIYQDIIIDTFLGLGLKYYNAKYNREITDEICSHPLRIFELPVGSGVIASYTLGIKVGYKF